MLNLLILQGLLPAFGVEGAKKVWIPGVLSTGAHPAPTPGGKNGISVRELRALALGLPWTSHPDTNGGPVGSPVDVTVECMNDAPWSSPQARTTGCLPLALLTSGPEPYPVEAIRWLSLFRAMTARGVLPMLTDALIKIHPNEDAKMLLLGYRGWVEQGQISAIPAKVLHLFPQGKVWINKKGDIRDKKGDPDEKYKDARSYVLDAMMASAHLAYKEPIPFTQMTMVARASWDTPGILTVTGQDPDRALIHTACALQTAIMASP